MDSLDGLRGLAVLLVVLSHTSNAGMFFVPFLDLRGVGKSGVFLFFLLSSFLLTLPLLRKGKEVLSFPVMAHYWQRRFFRIYPLYGLYLLLGVLSTLIITITLGRSGVGIPFGIDWAGFLRHLALQEGKGVTWSIAVEFKFYFLLPLLVFAIVRLRSHGYWAAVAFLLLLLVLSQIIFPQGDSVTNDARLLPYMPIFIMGMLIAVLQDHVNDHKISDASTWLCRSFGYIGVAGVITMTPLVYSLFGDEVATDYFHRQYILYALFWSFIIFSSVNARGLLQRFLALPMLRFYGALSFSLYLFHPIFIGVLSKIEVGGYVGAWLVLLTSTAAAYISFRLLEGPISRYEISQSALTSVADIARRFSRSK